MTAQEIRHMLHAEAIVDGYKLRSKMDAADFVKDHEGMNKILHDAQMLAEEFFGE